MTGSTLIPTLRYRDAHAAIDWLQRVFGFKRHAVYEGADGLIDHAELTLGGGMVMLGSVREGREIDRWAVQPEEIGGRHTGGVYVVSPDCDAAYQAAQAAGAVMLLELYEPDYGGKAFVCKDAEGHVWSVGSYDPFAPQSAAQKEPA